MAFFGQRQNVANGCTGAHPINFGPKRVQNLLQNVTQKNKKEKMLNLQKKCFCGEVVMTQTSVLNAEIRSTHFCVKFIEIDIL